MIIELGGTVTSTWEGQSTTGYVVTVTLVFEQRVGEGDPPEVLRVPVGGSARVGQDTGFTIRITTAGDGSLQGPAAVAVSAPDGTEVLRKTFAVEELEGPLELEVETVERPGFSPVDPAIGERPALTGRVVDKRGRETPPNLPVSVWVADDAEGDLRPVVVSQTQAGGFLTGPWPPGRFGKAEGRVAGLAVVPVRLDGEARLPRDLLLVLDLEEVVDQEECACQEPPPRAPEPADLVRNPAAFSQDLGTGCVDLTTPNRAIEEYTYRFVVRTSEPSVKALTLGGRPTVPPELLKDLLGASMVADALAPRPAPVGRAAVAPLSIDARSAKYLIRADRPPSMKAVGRAAWLSEVTNLKTVIDAGLREQIGRSELDAVHAIDWDCTPTVYQSIELAHGHVLQMREVWRADGYSLGDLLYSLPLAPGQQKLISVLDWERRKTARRDARRVESEEVVADLSRDRDVSDIVRSTLRETLDARSSADVSAVGGGLGGFIGPLVFGVAGGASSASSTASQTSGRQVSGSALNQVRDRTMQGRQRGARAARERGPDGPPGRVGPGQHRGRRQLQPLPRDDCGVLRGPAPPAGEPGAPRGPGVLVRAPRHHVVQPEQGAALAGATRAERAPPGPAGDLRRAGAGGHRLARRRRPNRALRRRAHRPHRGGVVAADAPAAATGQRQQPVRTRRLGWIRPLARRLQPRGGLDPVPGQRAPLPARRHLEPQHRARHRPAARERP